jgi:4,5:9,10-diseco-3-hydroxy-5,9,17-trioxoandrosta-1(10),2-diene-4-oate hydrolase
LHAIGHGGGDFSGVEAAQADAFRVITVDWPGHGYSGDDAQPASASRYAALLHGIVEGLHFSRVSLLGNSIGGAAAVIYAAAHPERVRALVLANPGGFDPGGSSFIGRLYIGTLLRHFEQGVRGEARFAEWFADYYAGILKADVAKHKRAAIVAAGYESARQLVQAWESFRTPAANLGPLLTSLKMPVLLAWAKDDTIVSWDRSEASAAQLPNAKVVFFEGAGHSAFLEAPDAFNAALRSFFGAL